MASSGTGATLTPSSAETFTPPAGASAVQPMVQSSATGLPVELRVMRRCQHEGGRLPHPGGVEPRATADDVHAGTRLAGPLAAVKVSVAPPSKRRTPPAARSIDDPGLSAASTDQP